MPFLFVIDETYKEVRKIHERNYNTIKRVNVIYVMWNIKKISYIISLQNKHWRSLFTMFLNILVHEEHIVNPLSQGRKLKGIASYIRDSRQLLDEFKMFEFSHS